MGADFELFVKYEGLNPTGSFKDRGMTAAISEALGSGARAVICASTGNTAASAAAYAARAGLRAIVLIPEGKVAAGKLAGAIAYALTVHVFLVLLELFTVLYSQVPEHVEHYRYLYFGLEGGWGLAPFVWLSSALAVLALVVLLAPRLRRSEPLLAAACVAVFLSLWLDKGLALIVAGFVPSPLGRVSTYVPTLPEVGVTAGIWAAGLILITAFVKIVMAVRRDAKAGVAQGV
jgi:molybdopterin-containing oxidoreductase family membrane subunit